MLPVFSPDGTKVMWTSTRDGVPEAQLFIADFVAPKESETAVPKGEVAFAFFDGDEAFRRCCDGSVS